MIRNKLCLFALGGLFAFLAAGVVRADDSALLDVLVKKGILTKSEAEKLETEAGIGSLRGYPVPRLLSDLRAATAKASRCYRF
jgi:uncharacterized protein HemY